MLISLTYIHSNACERLRRRLSVSLRLPLRLCLKANNTATTTNITLYSIILHHIVLY